MSILTSPLTLRGSSVILAILGLLVGAAIVYAAGAPQSSTMHYFDDPDQTSGDEVDGSSAQLHRTKSSVAGVIHTNDLDPGAYTVWWVVWNDPSVCSGGCGLDDLFKPGVFLGRATGKVVGGSGIGNFGASLSVGDISEALAPIFSNGGEGLTDPLSAEVHMIVRNHGPVVPANMPAQIDSFGGGCADFTCFDPQAVTFLAP